MSDIGTFDVVVAGNITLDDTALSGTEYIENAPGGDALYAAIGAWLWDVRVGVFSRIGEDYPKRYLEQLQQSGIDTSGIRECMGPSIHYRILYESANNRQFIHVTPAQRLAELSPEASELPGTYRHATIYHVAAMPTRLQAALIAAFQREKATVSLDPYEEDVEDNIDALAGMLYRNVICMPSELEVRLIASAMEVERIQQNAVEAAAWFCAQGCQLVSIKLGEYGSLTYSAQDRSSYRMPIFPARMVDPTGAGDAFCGGFLAGLIRYGSPLMAAACGTVSASLLIEDFGTMHALRSLTQERDRRLHYLLHISDLERSNRRWPSN